MYKNQICQLGKEIHYQRLLGTGYRLAMPTGLSLDPTEDFSSIPAAIELLAIPTKKNLMRKKLQKHVKSSDSRQEKYIE